MEIALPKPFPSLGMRPDLIITLCSLRWLGSFLAIWISLSAIFAYILDLLSLPLPLVALAITSLFPAMLMCYSPTAQGYSPPRKIPWLPILISTLAYVWFLWPSLPGLSPIGLRWDGANHIVLVNFLQTNRSHKLMQILNYNLTYGGDLPSYPWGMHAWCAGLGLLTGLPTPNVMAVLIPLFITATLVLWFHFITRRKTSPASVVCALTILAYSYVPLIHFNYWSQITGILLLAALADSLEQAESVKHRIFIVTLAGGVGLVYPLFAPIAFLATGYRLFHRGRLGPLRNALILAAISLVQFLYLIPHFNANIHRGKISSGPVLLTSIQIAMIAGIVLLSFALSRKLRSDSLSPFILTIAAFSVILLVTPLRLYYPGKLSYTVLFFSPPLLAQVLDYCGAFVHRYVSGQQGAVVAALFITAALIYHRPAIMRKALSPALSPQELEVSYYLSASADKPLTVLALEPLLARWVESVIFPNRVSIPIKFRWHALGLEQKPFPKDLMRTIQAQMVAGDRLVVMRHSLSNYAEVERIFTLKFQSGSILVLEKK